VNPFLFIVGCPRSGTTLLRRILDAHPEIAMTRETHWITQLLEEDGFSPDAPVTQLLLSRLRTYPKFTRMGIDQSKLDALLSRADPVSYSELVTLIFDLFGERHGKRWVGDKVPAYVRSIPLLHRLWLSAKFVHLVRDGRDVCSSLLSWGRDERWAGRFPATWAEDPLATMALMWEQLVRLGREAGAGLPAELYLELRYEDLVGDPARECRKLCDFLGVTFDERILNFHDGRTRDDPGLSAKKAWRPVTPGLRSWRSEMAPEDVERFEAVAGELLAELGYARGAPAPGAKARQRATLARESYIRDVGRPLPEHWAA
jgi:hypothetical protein